MDEYKESNRKLWDDWARLHFGSEFYDVQSFKEGRNSLHSLELSEVGDVSGKSLLHLQCHFGQDTLSWARLGAAVTGVDFSANAISLARSLAEELQIPANFVQSDVYDLPKNLEGRFDIVYTSYGVISWLPRLPDWGKVIAHFLKPGGTFYIVEGHPMMWLFEQAPDRQDLEVKWPYFQGPEPLRFDVEGSYAGDFDYRGVEYGWNHSVSEVLTSLLDAGLRIEFFHEFDFLVWKAFPMMERGEDRFWRLPGSFSVPLMFSLKATKPEA